MKCFQQNTNLILFPNRTKFIKGNVLDTEYLQIKNGMEMKIELSSHCYIAFKYKTS